MFYLKSNFNPQSLRVVNGGKAVEMVHKNCKKCTVFPLVSGTKIKELSVLNFFITGM